MTHIDVSTPVLKYILASLKTEQDKLDIDKLKTVLAYLSKLSNAANNDAVKKQCMEN